MNKIIKALPVLGVPLLSGVPFELLGRISQIFHIPLKFLEQFVETLLSESSVGLLCCNDLPDFFMFFRALCR